MVSGLEVHSLDCLNISVVARNVLYNINMPKERLTSKDFHSDIAVFIQLQDNTDAKIIHHILFRQNSAA